MCLKGRFLRKMRHGDGFSIGGRSSTILLKVMIQWAGVGLGGGGILLDLYCWIYFAGFILLDNHDYCSFLRVRAMAKPSSQAAVKLGMSSVDSSGRSICWNSVELA